MRVLTILALLFLACCSSWRKRNPGFTVTRESAVTSREHGRGPVSTSRASPSLAGGCVSHGHPGPGGHPGSDTVRSQDRFPGCPVRAERAGAAPSAPPPVFAVSGWWPNEGHSAGSSETVCRAWAPPATATAPARPRGFHSVFRGRSMHRAREALRLPLRGVASTPTETPRGWAGAEKTAQHKWRQNRAVSETSSFSKPGVSVLFLNKAEELKRNLRGNSEI